MITNARILGVDTNPVEYHATKPERGTPEFPMSFSSMVAFAGCPDRWKRGYTVKQSEEMKWGSVVDCLLLIPKRFDDIFAIEPATYVDAKTGEEKPWNNNAGICRMWKAEHAAQTILKHDLTDEACDAMTRLHADAEASEFITRSQKQVAWSAQWQDDGITIPIRGLIDLVPDKNHERFGKCLADLKTVRNANPAIWPREVFNRGYHIQAAFYLDAYVAATGEDRCEFRHVVQENVPPYQPALYWLESEFISMGRAAYKAILAKYCRCLKSGEWPGYQVPGIIPNWISCGPEAWMALRQIESVIEE